MTPFDPSRLSALVVDDVSYQRHLSMEQLRTMGFGEVHGAPDFDRALREIDQHKPHVVLIEWIEPRESVLKFVREVRAGRAGGEPYCNEVTLLMLTTESRLVKVESARAAGVDGYLRKPISVSAIAERVRFAVTRPKIDPAVDLDATATRARMLAMKVEREARALIMDGDFGDLRAALHALNEHAIDHEDTQMRFAVREMLRYLEVCEGGLQIDHAAVQTHASAMFQLALSPLAYAFERDRLAESLKKMVDKKIRIGANERKRKIETAARLA